MYVWISRDFPRLSVSVIVTVSLPFRGVGASARCVARNRGRRIRARGRGCRSASWRARGCSVPMRDRNRRRSSTWKMCPSPRARIDDCAGLVTEHRRHLHELYGTATRPDDALAATRGSLSSSWSAPAWSSSCWSSWSAPPWSSSSWSSSAGRRRRRHRGRRRRRHRGRRRGRHGSCGQRDRLERLDADLGQARSATRIWQFENVGIVGFGSVRRVDAVEQTLWARALEGKNPKFGSLAGNVATPFAPTSTAAGDVAESQLSTGFQPGVPDGTPSHCCTETLLIPCGYAVPTIVNDRGLPLASPGTTKGFADGVDRGRERNPGNREEHPTTTDTIETSRFER